MPKKVLFYTCMFNISTCHGCDSYVSRGAKLNNYIVFVSEEKFIGLSSLVSFYLLKAGYNVCQIQSEEC